MLSRTSILFCALLILASGCTKNGRLEDIEAGKYYVTEMKGKPVFFLLDEMDGGKGSGHYYLADGGEEAAPVAFSVKENRRKVIIAVDETAYRFKRTDLSFKPYVEPEFTPAETRLYREPFCDVKTTEDVVFGHVKGYWDSLPGVEADVTKAFTEGYTRSFRHHNIKLTLDLYRPAEATGPRPLILFIHGGAFYVGDKQEPAYIDFCRYFTSLGYVTASINYRMGFHAGKGEIERAGYVALQDAHAALRFLVSKADEYGIDTTEIYAAGSSAGAITALNLAFMTEESRPKSSHGAKGIFNGEDLGAIDASGNDIKADFHIRAVANMWGAVSSLDILKNSSTDIISFHGEEDNIVPYADGYPFSSAGRLISQSLSDPMYGSFCIDSTATLLGLRSEFYSFPDKGHAFNTTGKDKQPNSLHMVIRDQIKNFFYTEMVPEQARIMNDGEGWYSLSVPVATASWKAEGGFIISSDGSSDVQVLWRSDVPGHKLTATGTYGNGIGYITASGAV